MHLTCYISIFPTLLMTFSFLSCHFSSASTMYLHQKNQDHGISPLIRTLMLVITKIWLCPRSLSSLEGILHQIWTRLDFLFSLWGSRSSTQQALMSSDVSHPLGPPDSAGTTQSSEELSISPSSSLFTKPAKYLRGNLFWMRKQGTESQDLSWLVTLQNVVDLELVIKMEQVVGIGVNLFHISV